MFLGGDMATVWLNCQWKFLFLQSVMTCQINNWAVKSIWNSSDRDIKVHRKVQAWTGTGNLTIKLTETGFYISHNIEQWGKESRKVRVFEFSLTEVSIEHNQPLLSSVKTLPLELSGKLPRKKKPPIHLNLSLLLMHYDYMKKKKKICLNFCTSFFLSS